MNTPFKMRGWSPFTQKVDLAKEKQEIQESARKFEESIISSGSSESKTKVGKIVYDKETKLWTHSETGKTYTTEEIQKITKNPPSIMSNP